MEPTYLQPRAMAGETVTITDVRALPGDSAFLVDDGKTAVLYDTGFAFTCSAVLKNIRTVLGDRPVDYILLTHSHYDHALGVPGLLKAYPDAKVVAGEYAARIFAKDSAKAVMCRMNQKAAQAYDLPPADEEIARLRVDIPVKDGDRISCGSMSFTAVELPGHTKCSVGYYLAEEKLLLSTETLGVCCGQDTYLPSFLVGYRMALDSFRKARALEIRKLLLPHYGVVGPDGVSACLEKAEAVTVSAAQTIVELFRQGRTGEEILAFLTERDYTETVRPSYPEDAFLLNTKIMIDLVIRELISSPAGEQ